MYRDAKTREKRGFLSALLVKCDTLYLHITQSSNDFHLTQGKNYHMYVMIFI